MSPLPEIEPTSDQICLQHEESKESDDAITNLDYQYDTNDLMRFHTREQKDDEIEVEVDNPGPGLS